MTKLRPGVGNPIHLMMLMMMMMVMMVMMESAFLGRVPRGAQASPSGRLVPRVMAARPGAPLSTPVAFWREELLPRRRCPVAALASDQRGGLAEAAPA